MSFSFTHLVLAQFDVLWFVRPSSCFHVPSQTRCWLCLLGEIVDLLSGRFGEKGSRLHFRALSAGLTICTQVQAHFLMSKLKARSRSALTLLSCKIQSMIVVTGSV